MEEYMRRILTLSGKRLEKFALKSGKPLPERDMVKRLFEEVEISLNSGESRVILLHGLRGVGKTTMLAQLYFKLLGRVSEKRIIYVSVDEIKMLGFRLMDVFESYEHAIGERLEELSEPTVFLLDEVHYDENWDLALKVAHDRAKNLVVVATGSSAMEIKLSTDLARRAKRLHVTPLTFTEYLHLKGIHTDAWIKDDLKKLLLTGEADGIEEKIREVLLGFDPIEVERYLVSGSLPLALSSREPLEDAYSIVERIVHWDLANAGFSREILEKAFSLMLMLASGESLNYDRLTARLGISRPVLAKLLSALEALEVIFPVRAYGSLGKAVRKTPKYKFLAPALRAAILNRFGFLETDEKTLGNLLEDAVALYLYLMAGRNLGLVTYDASKGGADFILSTPREKVVIEVGWGEKDDRQVRRTMRKVKADRGVVVHGGAFKRRGNIIWLPNEWFLLML
ncbi:ATP-binding protein [Thermococcus sp. 21S7]|uniref:ATP-binding protein n=1 Tax=Thermococcus sp. 21S7 TaxID=1638221 RepID=UPI0014396B45|nr:ATP-binding protein [Thermococcus sp. 21S7]NJE62077.1 ATP-binding protein [Thermococcus sp. 21S7]